MYLELCLKLKGLMNALQNDERGVSALEYVILAAVVVAAVSAIGLNFEDIFSTVFGDIKNKATGILAG